MFLGTWGLLPPWRPPTRNIQDVPLGYLCRGQKLGLELCPTVTSQGHEPPEAESGGCLCWEHTCVHRKHLRCSHGQRWMEG